MKILKIEFQNINSLKGFHEVDFSEAPFTASSLFAITGPTGSGKSTLLDVISLALFNQVPRLGKITKNEIVSKGAILTRNQKEAYAKVTYSCKQGTYESLWGISTNSRGNLRDYEMQLFDSAAGKALDLKKSDVPAKNEELIGLNYNQFIKSVLLAQGEFAQFLKARKDERGEMLEKITGTGIYRLLGQRSFEKYREVNQDIQQQQNKMDLIRPKLLEPEKKKETMAALAEKEANYEPLEKAITSLQQSLELKKNLEKQQKEITSLKTEKAHAEKALQDFEAAHGLPLKQHEKVRHRSEELRNWSLLTSELRELDKEYQQKKKEQELNLQKITNCLQQTGDFTKSEVSAENISQELERFSKRVSGLQEQRREKRSRYESLQQQLSATLRDVEFRMDQAAPAESLRQLVALKEVGEAKVSQLREELAPLELRDAAQEKELLRHRLQKARQAQQKEVQLTSLAKELNNLQLEQDKTLTARKPLPEKAEKAKTQVSLLGSQLQVLQLKKKNELLQASLEQHRAHLESGKPCPLCGALEHPFSEELPQQQDSLDREIKQMETKLSEENHQLSSLTSSLQHYDARLEELKKEKSNKELLLNKEKAQFKEQFQDLFQNGENLDWERLCEQYDAHLNQVESYERESRSLKAISEGIPLHEELNEILKEGRKLKKELDALYAGEDVHRDCRKLQDDWIAFSKEQSGLKDQQQLLSAKINSKQELLRALEAEIKDDLQEKGFESILKAREALLADPEAHRLQQEQEKLKEKIGTHTTSLKLLERQLMELKKQDSEKPQEVLQEELQGEQKELKELREACEDLRRILKNDAELQQELAALQKETAEKEQGIKRWRLLNELIGDARGKKFNDFAQDLSLSQLLQLANRRLQDLSDRYQLDKPGDAEDDGLVAIDEHMGGQRRSVKTLSGGETFILSLAMALALSDLASRNVEIDSLFIDEGFGTLDPETLDQTLDTLEKLQAESSKTIGIISHVDSLKERIATQVKLERNGQGYSQLTVTS